MPHLPSHSQLHAIALRVYIRPALKAAGITGKVGWHTFRHSFATILKSHGEDVKTVQELLRHANSSITMNLYAQAVTDTKRSARLPGWCLSRKRGIRNERRLIGRYRTAIKLEIFL